MDYIVLFTHRQIKMKTETYWKNGPKSMNEEKETDLEGGKKKSRSNMPSNWTYLDNFCHLSICHNKGKYFLRTYYMIVVILISTNWLI